MSVEAGLIRAQIQLMAASGTGRIEESKLGEDTRMAVPCLASRANWRR